MAIEPFPDNVPDVLIESKSITASMSVIAPFDPTASRLGSASMLVIALVSYRVL